MVFSQGGKKSCGIACVIMTNFKMKKWDLACSLASAPAGISSAPIIKMSFDSAVKAEKEVYEAYAKVTGSPYNGTTDTFVAKLAAVLNKLNIGTWRAEWIGGEDMADTFSRLVGPGKPPVIALVHWAVSGGHFVVCDTIGTTLGGKVADFCDPWDGALRTVRLVSGSPITYSAQADPAQIDMGRSHFQYASPDVGDADGWVIRKVA